MGWVEVSREEYWKAHDQISVLMSAYLETSGFQAGSRRDVGVI